MLDDFRMSFSTSAQGRAEGKIWMAVASQPFADGLARITEAARGARGLR